MFNTPSNTVQLNIITTQRILENGNTNENVTFPNKTEMDTNSRDKKSIHVPKFMLELYEKNRKEGKNLHQSDVVKSLIPTHSGEQ